MYNRNQELQDIKEAVRVEAVSRVQTVQQWDFKCDLCHSDRLWQHQVCRLRNSLGSSGKMAGKGNLNRDRGQSVVMLVL